MNAGPMMVTQQTVRKLAPGDKFFLRVAAVSPAGAGPPATLDQPIHIREIIGKAWRPTQPVPGTHGVDGEAEANGQRGQAVIPVPIMRTSHVLSPSCL